MHLKRSALNVLAWLLGLLFILPIFWMIIVSVKPEGNNALQLKEWFTFNNLTLNNYIKVIHSSPILLWTYNSLIIAILSTIILLFLSSLAAFALSKINFKAKFLIYCLLVTGLLVPTEAILIPLYDTMFHFKLIDNMWGIILPSLTHPLGIFLLKQFMDGVPNDYIEAAALDGCNKIELWWKICLPLTKPAMVAISIFFFLLSWNNYIWPYICINSQENMVLPTGIPIFLGNNIFVLNTVMTASAIAAIPAMIVFITLQKFIVQGVSMAGIKG